MSLGEMDYYSSKFVRALGTRGGHLSIGRGGWTLYYDNSSLSGYACEEIKRAAIDAGVPVIDSRMVPFEVVAQLAVRGPMVAVNRPPSPRPWGTFSYASLAAVATAYRRAGAEVFNISDSPEDEAIFCGHEGGPLGDLIDFWLTYVLTHGEQGTSHER